MLEMASRYFKCIFYVTVTIDKLPMSDDDQAPMPSAPPSTAMDFIQGYDAIPMNDGG